MSTYFRLRAVPPPALRNSAAWLERLFEGDRDNARHLFVQHHDEVLDSCHLDQDLLYAAGASPHHADHRPRSQVVLGGRPVFHPDRDKPPFLVLTAAQAHRVASFLTMADFDALWVFARGELLPRYGGATAEPETRGAFAAAHRRLTAFYAQTSEHGEAVVKWLPA
jgi:hypothetical protein